MKKLGIFLFAIALSAVFFTACQKEETVLKAEKNHEEVLTLSDDDVEVDARMIEDVTLNGVVAVGPDLVVSGFTSNLPLTGSCAVPVGSPRLPNATCNGTIGGNTSFLLSIRVQNIGNLAVPAGTFKVAWALTGSALQGLSTVNHPTIPPGGSIAVRRNWTLPCATQGPPIGLNARDFTATVDVTNLVAERNENNNVSRPYRICDDI